MLRNVERRRIALPERGVELALLDWGGTGPLALLHHANGFCAALWDPIAERLRERFRVVAYDARGHGDSSCPEGRAAFEWSQFWADLLAVACELTAEGPHRSVALGLGHSFGGTSMVLAAAKRPDLFERLVLLDPVLMPPPEVKVPDGADNTSPLAEGARRRRHVWPSPDSVIESWSRPGHPFSTWDHRALEIYAHEGFRRRNDGQIELKCSGEVEATIYEMNQSINVYASAPHVKAPVLIVRGAHTHFPELLFERLVSDLPRAELDEVDDAGHLLLMEEPDAVADRILAFAAASPGVD
jgi:pimeloyl-ACP methyl ester carboxylesterase